VSRNAVELKDVTYSFSSGHPVLRDVSLEVEPRDFLAVIGPNGGGKTTLMKIILGLLEPDSGSVRVFGRRPESARGLMGYVPQDTTFKRDFPIRALDAVLMGRLEGIRPFAGYSREDRRAALDKMRMLGIGDLAGEKVGNLSGGQRQRVFIARALATDPQLLLLDEPAASVDPNNQESFYHLLGELNDRMTIIMVTHDVGAVSSYVKTVACLNVGLASHGEGLDHESMAEAYGCPIELLAHGVPHRLLGEKRDLEGDSG
jgi:zinc transport system ATP-binding protein